MILYATYSPDFKDCPKKTKSQLFTEIQEEEDYYKYFLELPGYPKENVKLHLKDFHLSVMATSVDREKIEKTILLPRDANIESLSAKLENGVFEIFALKDAKIEKTIEIQ